MTQPIYFVRGALVALMLASASCTDPSGPVPASTDRFASISAGSMLVCGVGLDGYAYCWGGNEYGQVGSPSRSQCIGGGLEQIPCATRPQRVGLQEQLTAVSAGAFHACALTADGTAYCWGANYDGQLGRGASGGKFSPGRVVAPVKFSQIVAQWRHTCALDINGVVWCWGLNEYGQLGRGTNDVEPHPASAQIGSDLRFTSLGKGLAHHTCGIAVTGGAWCWGVNQDESLGTSTTEKCLSNPYRFYGDLCATRPVRALPDLALDSITSGDMHGCARTSSGEWTCWGSATNGNLGIGLPQDCVTTVDGIEYHRPCNRDRLPVVGSASFTEMHAGSGFTCAVDLDKQGWCWGGPVPFGSLGTGIAEHTTDVPVQVAGDILFTQLSVGGYNVCGLDASGAAWCWGYARSGAIGDGTFQEGAVDVPTRVLAR